MKKIISGIIAVIVWLGAGQAMAVEDKPQMGFVISSSRHLNASETTDLGASMAFINLMDGHAPYTSLSLSHQFSQHFNAGISLGYGFEEEDEETGESDAGVFSGIDLNLKYNDLAIYNGIYYYAGFDMLFTAHSINYPLGLAPLDFVRVGIDARNFHYYSAEDKGSRSYQIGPAVIIPLSENASVKLNYFYGYQPFDDAVTGDSAMDSHFYEATFVLGF